MTQTYKVMRFRPGIISILYAFRKILIASLLGSVSYLDTRDNFLTPIYRGILIHQHSCSGHNLRSLGLFDSAGMQTYDTLLFPLAGIQTYHSYTLQSQTVGSSSVTNQRVI